jgi:translation initiation factor 2-alpha kinase 3
MYMFRKPGESSSSEDEAADGRAQASASAKDNFLSRINTLDSARSGLPSSPPLSELQVAPTASSIPRSEAGDNIRDLVLHSLLEEKATREAADYLGKDQSDPEVQELARETYKRLAEQLPGATDNVFASDEMRDTRAAAQEGINNATRLQLTNLSAAPGAAATAAMAGPSQALIPRSILDHTSNLSGRVESLLSLQHPIPSFLEGHPGLHTDRYTREYEELEVVGKGGYGKVYKVKHKLDNSFYAVKKIVVSPAKMQKIQEHGVQEMEGLLEEVRSLARFDHINIVRYHSAWFEFSGLVAGPSMPSTTTALGPERLLRHATAPSFSDNEVDQLQTDFDSLAVFEPTSPESAADIVFEASETGAGAEEAQGKVDAAVLNKRAREADRRGSEATIATISSARSRRSTMEEAPEDEEEIELIPRSHSPTYADSYSDSDRYVHLRSQYDVY